MLTREEAIKFLEAIRSYNFDNYSGSQIRQIMIQHLHEFTEKPKREVQVGDIFLNGKKTNNKNNFSLRG